jgi:hypothetical protein
MLGIVREQRKDIVPEGEEIKISEWVKLDTNKNAVEFAPIEMSYHFLRFKFRHTTPLKLFLTFIDQKLLKKVWYDGIKTDYSEWSYRKGTRTINSNQYSPQLLYMFYAIKIYIQGNARTPSEGKPGSGRNLRDAVDAAREFFTNRYPDCDVIGSDILEHLLGHFLILGDSVDLLCTNFRSIVASLGETVVGDEKLFEFTGVSGDSRFVITKPARIGLWFYELVGNIDNYNSFLLDTKIASVKKEINEHEHVANIVQRWIEVINSFYPRNHPLLVFDSYYWSKATRRILNEARVRYIAAVGSGKLGGLEVRATNSLKQPGNWVAYWNKYTAELYVMNWDRDSHVGKQQVITNTHTLKKGYRQLSRIIPAYDLYKLIYSGCDHYNRKLNDKCWPFKHGGNERLGDMGSADDFVFSCTLQNIINVDRELSHSSAEKLNYEAYLTNLACELFEYAMNLKH